VGKDQGFALGFYSSTPLSGLKAIAELAAAWTLSVAPQFCYCTRTMKWPKYPAYNTGTFSFSRGWMGLRRVVERFLSTVDLPLRASWKSRISPIGDSG
jgi:hypothetical protein